VNDFDAMGRALTLAWRGWGRVAPNPLVGAVVLQGDRIVGEGWHAEFGGPHAETIALKQAGPAALGATVFVTLEPCSHKGKQPPCADALIRSGVRRVVAATSDPNPVAQGGVERLRAAGITVEVGLREEEAKAQNALFLHRWQGFNRPYVGLKLATTLDGQIADADGRSRWISGDEARDYVHWLRAGYDAIGVGGHTARIDDSSLTVRGTIEPRVAPRRVIFDRMGHLPSSLALVRSATEIPTLLLTHAGGPSVHLAELEAQGVLVYRINSLADGLALLWQAGITSLLVEGGGRLAGALLAADLIDRYYWIQSPVWLGADAIPGIVGLPGTSLMEAERWGVVDRRALGQDTLLVVDRNACLPGS
jgi:diaminohydroxyphosphoribosylaminopyrimidine deaminase/5-amino-6-(5-phosphoribosylamino)uracil reductase